MKLTGFGEGDDRMIIHGGGLGNIIKSLRTISRIHFWVGVYLVSLFVIPRTVVYFIGIRAFGLSEEVALDLAMLIMGIFWCTSLYISYRKMKPKSRGWARVIFVIFVISLVIFSFMVWTLGYLFLTSSR